jgi:hypothetical protein
MSKVTADCGAVLYIDGNELEETILGEHGNNDLVAGLSVVIK